VVNNLKILNLLAKNYSNDKALMKIVNAAYKEVEDAQRKADTIKNSAETILKALK
jgi:hypothetical protein